MKTEMKVLLYLKKNEQDSDGFCPLMGKITLKSEFNSVAQFSCKIKVKPKIWNATSQRCSGKSRTAVSTNRDIETLLLSIRSHFNELKDNRSAFTATDVKNTFQGIASTQATLLKLFQEHNDEYALRVGVNRAETTYYQYRNTMRLLSSFVESRYKVSDVPLKSLDETFIEAFDMYLHVDLKQKSGTVVGHVNRLKSIVYTGVYKGYLNLNPFTGYRTQRAEKADLHLTPDELSRLMNTTFDTPNRNFTRDMFVFSAFTGYSYCDMCALTESNVIHKPNGTAWIITDRIKTGTPENVLLMEIPLKIIEKYKGTAKNGKLFPMLLNTSINPHLKKMARQCGINRNLTFHMARHTFGSSILSQGVPIETVSRAMGHKNISTTQRYAKLSGDKVRRDVSAVESIIKTQYSLAGINEPPSTILKDMSRRKVRPSKKLQNTGG